MARPCFTLMTPVQAFITETSFAFANQKHKKNPAKLSMWEF